MTEFSYSPKDRSRKKRFYMKLTSLQFSVWKHLHKEDLSPVLLKQTLKMMLLVSPTELLKKNYLPRAIQPLEALFENPGNKKEFKEPFSLHLNVSVMLLSNLFCWKKYFLDKKELLVSHLLGSSAPSVNFSSSILIDSQYCSY